MTLTKVHNNSLIFHTKFDYKLIFKKQNFKLKLQYKSIFKEKLYMYCKLTIASGIM